MGFAKLGPRVLLFFWFWGGGLVGVPQLLWALLILIFIFSFLPWRGGLVWVAQAFGLGKPHPFGEGTTQRVWVLFLSLFFWGGGEVDFARGSKPQAFFSPPSSVS